MPEPGSEQPGAPMAAGSVSLRLYPHNELSAVEIVDWLCTMAATAATTRRTTMTTWRRNT